MIEIKNQNFYNDSFRAFLLETFPRGVIDKDFYLEGCNISSPDDKPVFDAIVMAYYPLRWIIMAIIKWVNNKDFAGDILEILLNLNLVKITKFYGYFLDTNINITLKNNNFIGSENVD